jgi:hypothetical protein
MHLSREWVEEALVSPSKATLRRPRLPAERVVWLVLGTALMRDRPIVDVVRQLDLVMPDERHAAAARRPDGTLVSQSAMI